MPQWILAAVSGTDMTIFYPLAVYTAIQWKLNKPLVYPGDLTSWDNNHPISTGLLNAMFYEWLVLSPHTAGQSFNIADGSEFTFGTFWPILASWYGLPWLPPSEDAHYHETEMPFKPRGYVLCANNNTTSELTLHNSYGPKGKLRYSFKFSEWAKESATQAAWAELTKDHGLQADPLKDPEKTFAFLQFALELTWSWATRCAICTIDGIPDRIANRDPTAPTKLVNLAGWATVTPSSRCAWYLTNLRT